MDATTIERAIQQLKQNILNSMHHETLFQHLGEPRLLDRQLFFLLLPKLNGEAWQANVETAALSVGIVHASLAEHAKINEQEITKDQQLTVLSGDYYSGRYYQLLAHKGDIRMIKALSQAIVKRSEQTVYVLEHQTTSVEEWTHAVVTIEIELLRAFYETYRFERYLPLMENALSAAKLRDKLTSVQMGQVDLVPSFVSADILEQKISKLHIIVRQQIEQMQLPEALVAAIEQLCFN